MEESSTYQEILAEGIKKGELRCAHRMLLLVGGKRFGPPSGKVRAAVEEIRDMNRLDQMWLQILDASSWQELLESPH
jgi:hypothetical protein